MKVVIAPQSFKGSISALDAAKAMEEGVLRVVPDAGTVLVPVADGGDGTLETLVDATGGETRSTTVTGPIGKLVTAEWGRARRWADRRDRDGAYLRSCAALAR